MAVVRPFRAVRAVPARVDPGALIAASVDVDDHTAASLLGRDPRNVVALLGGDAVRARFLLKEQLRAGVVARDPLPGLYVLKVQGSSSSMGFFAVVRADSVDVDVAPDASRTQRLRSVGIAIEPVVMSYVDKKGRVARSLESETEREPDATFEIDGKACELWAVDDDSAAARVTALVEAQPLTISKGAAGLAAHQALVSEDAAAGYALAFFVDEESPVDVVPVGVVFHSLDGSLS